LKERTILAKACRAVGEMTGARKMATRAVDYATRTWKNMGQAREGTMKRRIYDAGMYAMDRIDPNEYTLRGMPRMMTSMEIVYPSTATAKDARAVVETKLMRSAMTARRATWFNAIGVPLSLPMFLSPVSNFPIYWFVFRLWGTTEATRGGREALATLRLTSADDASAIEAKIKECTKITECKRLRPINVLNSDTGQEVSTTDEAHALVCCRLAQAGGATFLGDDGPPVLFVPCDALANVVNDDHGDELSENAAAKIERLFGASGIVDFVRRYKKYAEIYPVSKPN